MRSCAAITGLVALSLSVTACGGTTSVADEAAVGCDGVIPESAKELSVWYHLGEEADSKVINGQVESFNASQDEVHVTLKQIPVTDYPTTIKGAEADGSLPDVLDADASYAFNYAWNGDLQPIDNCIPADLKADLLPSIVEGGTYADKQWAVGLVDSAIGIWVHRSVLEGAGVRVPTTPADAWTAEEFKESLVKLRAAGYERPLDVSKQYGKGEWYAYAFAPIVWSAGGDLVDRDGYKSAEGALNSPAVVNAMTQFQGYFSEDYVDDNTDNNAFQSGRSPMSWSGYWQYADYKAAAGDDLVLVPLPDYGTGSKTSQGGWQWGITSNAKDADASWKWISYTLNAENLAPYAEANSSPAGRSSVVNADPLYQDGGPLRLLVEQLEDGSSVPRPPHPVYATVSSAWGQAVQDIIDGTDVAVALDKAVVTIDEDIASNEGYPAPQS